MARLNGAAGSREPGRPEGMQSLIRGLAVLRAVDEADGPIGVGELGRRVDLHKSTVQRIVKTLQIAGWLEPVEEPRTRWVISRSMSGFARSHPSDLRDVAYPGMKLLGHETGETIHLSVPRDQRVVLIDRVDSVHPVRAFLEIGASFPLYGTAAGRAMLAFMDDARTEAVLRAPMSRGSDDAPVRREAVETQLREVRRLGYAVSISEVRDHTLVTSAPLFSRGDEVIGALSISMPDFRCDQSCLAERGRLVRAVAADVSAKLS